MREFFPAVWENRLLCEQIGRLAEKDTLAHAYLIQGSFGTGKHLFAMQLAASLCCEHRTDASYPLPCGKCNACRKIFEKKTPDLFFVSKGENATIGIETVRKLKESVYLSPVENPKKIYIIEEAEKMTPAAQNALLVLLEEPPKDMVVLLLSEDGSSLLPTVKSRVQVLRMGMFSREKLDVFLDANPIARRLKAEDVETYQTVLTVADGSPGKALLLTKHSERKEMFDERNTTEDILACFRRNLRFSELYDAVFRLSSKRNVLLGELNMLTVALRDLIVLRKASDVSLCYFTSRESAEACAASYSLRSLFRIYDSLQDTANDVNMNANVYVSLTAMVQTLYAVLTK